MPKYRFMEKKNRPLSPHLTIYKPQITSIVSIFHRISGSILALSLILFSFIFYLDTTFSEYYLLYYVVFNCELYAYWFLISLINFLFVIICFHFCNGLRHLCWDFGFGLDIKNVYITGLVVLAITSVILFIITL